MSCAYAGNYVNIIKENMLKIFGKVFVIYAGQFARKCKKYTKIYKIMHKNYVKIFNIWKCPKLCKILKGAKTKFGNINLYAKNKKRLDKIT